MSYAGVACFWAEETHLGEWSLRRYAAREKGECPSVWGYHTARTVLPGEHRLQFDGDGSFKGFFKKPPMRDPRWPRVCECGYVFTRDDHWQTNVTRLYLRADTEQLVALRGPEGQGGQGPPGMLFHMDWDPFGVWTDRYGDGIHLHAVCPNGSIWDVDGPALADGKVTNPQAWTRAGDPRVSETLSVTPSIVAGDYHGFLTAGWFTDG